MRLEILLSEVCHDVCIESTLQPIAGEALSGASAITEDGARLDVAANGFWVVVLNAPSLMYLAPMLYRTDNLFPKTRKH